LTGKELDVFYLNSKNEDTINYFNSIFIDSFELTEKLSMPSVIFFDVFNEDVENIEVIELEESNLLLAFKELYEIIKTHINNEKLLYKDSNVYLSKGMKFLNNLNEKILLSIIVDKIKNLLIL